MSKIMHMDIQYAGMTPNSFDEIKAALGLPNILIQSATPSASSTAQLWIDGNGVMHYNNNGTWTEVKSVWSS